MTAPTLEAERAAPCPFCGGTATPMHADDCYFVMQQKLRDAPKGDLSLVPEVLAAWNRRTAIPAPADVAPPLDAEGLPPLPKPIRFAQWTGGFEYAYTAEQVRQAQRAAYEAGKLAVIVDSQCEVASDLAGIRARLVATQQPAQSIDTPAFRTLLNIYRDTDSNQLRSARATLIAHIDGRAAGTAPNPVAWAVTAERGGIHKLTITKESAERKAAVWREEWPNNGCKVRPLIFGDAAAPSPLLPKEDAQ